MIKLKGLDELVPDQSQVRLDQKKKQHSFQEIPLLINGTLLILSSQEAIMLTDLPQGRKS